MPGTQIKILDGSSPATPLLIEGLQTFSPPQGTRPRSEYTPISETGRKKFKSQRPIYGTGSGECAFDPTDPSQLQVLSLSQIAPNSAIVHFEAALTEHGAQALMWPGYISECGFDFPNEGVAKMNFGIQATGTYTAQSPASITPSSIYNPEVCQGSSLLLWISSAYVAIAGVESFSLKSAARDSTPATEISATVGTVIPGLPGEWTLEITMMYDSTIAAQAALRTSFDTLAVTADKFKILMPGGHNIILDPVNVTGWGPPSAPGGPNMVKVVGMFDGTVTVS